MSQHYSSKARALGPHSLPDVKTFESLYRYCYDCQSLLLAPTATTRNAFVACADCQASNELNTRGWFWHACFPGCLPDSEPNGPFATEADAIADARQDDEPTCTECRAVDCPHATDDDARCMEDPETEYQVIVGNIGTVYSGDNIHIARKTFAEYVEQSQSGIGRAGHETVTILADGEPQEEYTPDNADTMNDAIDNDEDKN